MKRRDVFGFAFMENVKSDQVSFDDLQVEIDEDYIISDLNPQNALLRLVYAIDERTKLPLGDLAYYVSDKANPEIKKFILDNLMMDVSHAANKPLPDGLSDSDALLFARKSTESLEDYVGRLNSEIKAVNWLNDEYKKSLNEKSSESSVL